MHGLDGIKRLNNEHLAWERRIGKMRAEGRLNSRPHSRKAAPARRHGQCVPVELAWNGNGRCVRLVSADRLLAS
jgi:hypothetical protein